MYYSDCQIVYLLIYFIFFYSFFFSSAFFSFNEILFTELKLKFCSNGWSWQRWIIVSLERRPVEAIMGGDAEGVLFTIRMKVFEIIILIS